MLLLRTLSALGLSRPGGQQPPRILLSLSPWPQDYEQRAQHPGCWSLSALWHSEAVLNKVYLESWGRAMD